MLSMMMVSFNPFSPGYESMEFETCTSERVKQQLKKRSKAIVRQTRTAGKRSPARWPWGTGATEDCGLYRGNLMWLVTHAEVWLSVTLSSVMNIIKIYTH
ncbi:hypothetical protein CSKR_201525 [Clonorchis sinensis]|uniref:Uncharacterized protein n=1 Tax=Clonorchis sinensis TaxID=79923 RepID=A0A8T1MRY9_CLOSI|nr:hypothetical protein CSKR_201525 [Clonorchis sinensis]